MLFCIAEMCQRRCLCQVWLQEIAWTEAEKPIKLAARGAMIPNDPKMDREPVFCYETMLNLLYWSCLVYDHDRVGATLLYTVANKNVVHPVKAAMRLGNADMEQLPIFCFQTVLNLLCWSCLTFDHDRVTATPIAAVCTWGTSYKCVHKHAIHVQFLYKQTLSATMCRWPLSALSSHTPHMYRHTKDVSRKAGMLLLTLSWQLS